MDPTWSPERWRAVAPLFEKAMDLPPEERDLWLETVRTEDPALADDLKALLADHLALEGEKFLESSSLSSFASANLAGQSLGAYTLVSPIGQGGMGIVWLAKRSDGRFEGAAAVKLLSASLLGGAGEERFRREGSILARLHHPRIAQLLDAGLSPWGQPYLVLEYVEGVPIDRHGDQKNLDIEQRLRLFLGVLEAVAHAHVHHVVHRDIKPSNVLVGADGRVKLLDFGIAKLLEGEAAAGEATMLTREAGRALTPEYAAPEQIAGGAITASTDVYSLGVLLYEILVGVHPLDTRRLREAGWAEIDRIIREEEPVRPSTRVSILGATAATVAGHRKTDAAGLRRELAGDLDWITLKALEKDPARRYASAAELKKDLERHLRDEPVTAAPPTPMYRMRKRIRRNRVRIATAAFFVLAIAGAFFLGRPPAGVRAPTGVKRLAVLPFENLGAPQNDYFADGIADAVRGKLTSLPGLQVIARDSSTAYKKTTKRPEQIAKELDVEYLLTATVRWNKETGGGNRVQVSPELIEVPASGAPTAKWQQPFDAALTDVFQVQSDIATRVARRLNLALGVHEEKRLSEKPTQDIAAYDAFLKAREVKSSEGSGAGLRRAMAFLEEAVALDPNFAEAWAGLSFTSALLYRSAPTPELAERARTAAERAREIASDGPEGHLALGAYELHVALDPARALEHFVRAERVAPGDSRVLLLTGVAERSLGRWESAVKHLQKAERIDPSSVAGKFQLGSALLYRRRFPEARETLDKGLTLAPGNLILITLKATTWLGQGDLAEARAVLEAVPEDIRTSLVANMARFGDLVWVLAEEQRELLLRLTPSAFDGDRGTWSYCLAQAYALKGNAPNLRTHAEEARKAIEVRVRAAPQDAQAHSSLGLALAYLGRKEEAIREGQRGAALAAKDAVDSPYMKHQLVRIYILVGEPEKALDQLEPLLKIPYFLSARWLAIDPNFDPLRKNPRFQRLVAQTKREAA